MRKTKIISRIIFATALSFVLSACSTLGIGGTEQELNSEESDTPEITDVSESSDLEDSNLQIVTSFYPVYQMTAEVTGELNDVFMIQSGSGIHSFEPSIRDVQAINDADIFIYHSRTLESWADSVDESTTNSDVVIIEASQDLELLRVPGLEDIEVTEGIDEKTLYDPHTWTDPILAAEEVEFIAEALAELDSANAEYYLANAASFRESAEELVEEYSGAFATLEERTFVTQHTAFYYLAERFDLEQLGIAGISAENEPSARQLAEIQDFVIENDIGTIFIEPNTSAAVARVVAEATGAELEYLDPLEADPQNNESYLSNMENNLEVLSESLAGTGE